MSETGAEKGGLLEEVLRSFNRGETSTTRRATDIYRGGGLSRSGADTYRGGDRPGRSTGKRVKKKKK